MLDILSGELHAVLSKIANLERMKGIEQKLLDEAKRRDARLFDAVKDIDGLAHRLDHLEQMTAQILASERAAHGKLDDISAPVGNLTTDPAAAVNPC